jgi:ABC-type glycerol-3-phosphate transport system substrate-binding protein
MAKQMMKRADGSVSQRGLWDNIRAAAKKNKAAGKPGKKPTAAMLKQERKIKAKSK